MTAIKVVCKYVPRLAPRIDDLGLDLVHQVVDIPHRNDGYDNCQANHDVLNDSIFPIRFAYETEDDEHSYALQMSIRLLCLPSSDCSRATPR